jgi:hypothetical protein
MTDPQTWVEALNIKPELLAEWSAQAPARKPILVHCIEQGLVDYGEYMRWAQERFGLAVLQANYFQATFDPNQLEQIKSSGDWHPWIFPVEQWEGVTFVACVEPPQESDSPDVRYVLADPRAMHEAWGGTITSIGRLKIDDVPPPVPDAPVEMPEGLAAAPKPFVLELDQATFNIGPVTEVKPMPEEPPPAEKIEEAPEAPPVVAKAPPKAPELKVVPAVAEAPAAKPAATIKDIPVTPAAPAAAKKAPVQRVSSADEDDAVKALFTALRERYSASLIMKCSEQNARVYQHDESLSPAGDAAKTTVNLSYPTFMRIVAKTNLPYHGYLVDSPAHNEFFAALGLDKLPTCVTAIPVRFENVLWGMVVAFGTEENQKMDSLNFAQEATERLLNSVAANWSKAG